MVRAGHRVCHLSMLPDAVNCRGHRPGRFAASRQRAAPGRGTGPGRGIGPGHGTVPGALLGRGGG